MEEIAAAAVPQKGRKRRVLLCSPFLARGLVGGRERRDEREEEEAGEISFIKDFIPPPMTIIPLSIHPPVFLSLVVEYEWGLHFSSVVMQKEKGGFPKLMNVWPRLLEFLVRAKEKHQRTTLVSLRSQRLRASMNVFVDKNNN